MEHLNPAYTALIQASQQGLAIEPQPYLKLAQDLGVSEDDVIQKFQTMLDQGLIRRIAAIPNHYALGYVANGMCVWNIADDSVDTVGAWLGSQAGVSHCYRRPRRLPAWPYNLFAMLHGTDHDTVCAQAKSISRDITQHFPGVLHAHDILFSTAILKKTGLRLRRP
ncbi:Lrp/AsnC family transcriptional regulator [Alcaligenes faecalis]|uniref:siroheme decarboxylase subunit beta n=1 Tax=Alcaligenes faecalis TaxID=511 RepID=UPI0029321B91|nr:Lrp/AsnC family transcriptional regulator [Alcaligenes faecalis]MDV2116088.1 Lrp/AsnC family transcriptional regulator [Alcaligenes faecalis]